LYKISKIMGNSPQVCEKHYAALQPESLYESVEFSVTAPLSSKPVASIPQPPAVKANEVNRPMLRLVINNR
jgi:hypothetical protein